MKKLFPLFVALIALGVLSVLIAPSAFAQSATPPTLPTLDHLLKTSLSALGALVFIGLFGYYWGYAVSALAARVPWTLPSWVWDAVVLVPTAAVAAGWNAFALFIHTAFPGVMDKTVADVLLFAANYLMSLFFTRRGGLANVADVSRWVHGGTETLNAASLTQRARSGVLLLV